MFVHAHQERHARPHHLRSDPTLLLSSFYRLLATLNLGKRATIIVVRHPSFARVHVQPLDEMSKEHPLPKQVVHANIPAFTQG